MSCRSVSLILRRRDGKVCVEVLLVGGEVIVVFFRVCGSFFSGWGSIILLMGVFPLGFVNLCGIGVVTWSPYRKESVMCFPMVKLGSMGVVWFWRVGCCRSISF